MDTTFEHIGNLLYRASEQELHRVFVQFMKKQRMTKDEVINYISEIIDCKYFDYYGNMDREIEEYLLHLDDKGMEEE